MIDTGLQEVDTYVSRRQNTAAKFIVTKTIMDLCLMAERRLGSRATKQWWEQDVLDVEDMCTAAWEAERTEEGRRWTGRRRRQTKLVGG